MKTWTQIELTGTAPTYPAYPSEGSPVNLEKYRAQRDDYDAYHEQREQLLDEIQEAKARARRNECLPMAWCSAGDLRYIAHQETVAIVRKKIAEKSGGQVKKLAGDILEAAISSDYVRVRDLGRELVEAAGLCCVAPPVVIDEEVFEALENGDHEDVVIARRASAGSFDSKHARLGGD